MSATVQPITNPDVLAGVSGIVGVKTLASQIATVQTSVNSFQSQLTAMSSAITDLQSRVVNAETVVNSILNS